MDKSKYRGWVPSQSLLDDYRRGAPAASILQRIPASVIEQTKRRYGYNTNPNLVDKHDVDRLLNSANGHKFLKRHRVKPVKRIGTYQVSLYSREEVLDVLNRGDEVEPTIKPMFLEKVDIDCSRRRNVNELIEQAVRNPTPKNVWTMIYELASQIAYTVKCESREDLKQQLIVDLSSAWTRRRRNQPIARYVKYLRTTAALQAHHYNCDEARRKNRLSRYGEESIYKQSHITLV